MNPTHKSLVGVATASALLIVSSMARADGPSTPTKPAATTVEPVVAKRSPLPIVTMAVGGTVALVGLCFYSLASTNKSQAYTSEGLNRDYGTTLDSKKLHDKSESEQKTGTILLAGGAVVAVGGLVWFFIDGQRVRSANASASASANANANAKATAASTIRLTPAVGPGTTGAYLQGTF